MRMTQPEAPAPGQVATVEIQLRLTLYQTLREHRKWVWQTWGGKPRPVAEVLMDCSQPMLGWAVKTVHVRHNCGPGELWVLTDPPPGTPAVRLGRLLPPGEDGCRGR
jgi:hypothetical protein